MKRAILASALFLAACGSVPKEPVIQVQEVDKPTAVSCVPETVTVKPPVYTDTKEALVAAPDHAARYDLLAKNYGPRAVRLDLLEAVVAACRKIQPPAKKVAP